MLYVVGGFEDVPRFGDFSHLVANVDRYDPLSNQWTSVTPMLTSRCGQAVVTFGNYIYAIRGENDEGKLKTVERYDVLNDKWEFVASMKYERKFSKAVVFNKKIYVFGGYQGYKNDFVKIVECYDEETNEWKEVAKMIDEDINQVIVSYQPCVPDICKNIPF